MNYIAKLAAIMAMLVFVSNICIAYGVYKDAERLHSTAGEELRIMSSKLWAISCLFGGFMIFIVYAALHHSTFKLRNEK